MQTAYDIRKNFITRGGYHALIKCDNISSLKQKNKGYQKEPTDSQKKLSPLSIIGGLSPREEIIVNFDQSQQQITI
jgi:hypothetical protein